MNKQQGPTTLHRNYIQYPTNEEYKKRYLCMYNRITLKLTQYAIQLYISKISYKQKSSLLPMWWRSSSMKYTLRPSCPIWVPTPVGGEGVLPLPCGDLSSLSTVSDFAQLSITRTLWLTQAPTYAWGWSHCAAGHRLSPGHGRTAHDHCKLMVADTLPSSFTESSMVFVWVSYWYIKIYSH